MISGVAAGFFISNLWKYSKNVAKIQKKLAIFKAKHKEQHHKITHAVKQHTRLTQQQPLVEPILGVLAKAYRVQLQSDVSARAQVTTNFDPEALPACVTLARAIDTDEIQMKRLRQRALRVLMSPGWRTNGLNEIARIHADSRMLDSNSLSLKNLDTDSVVSASNAQMMLTDAFNNTAIHHRVSKSRLVRAIKDLHSEVLAKWDSDERPQVVSMRDDGFDKIAFQSSWLVDEDVSEDWISFLMEILGEETAPFGQFDWNDKEFASTYANRLIDQIEARGISVRDRLESLTIRTPADLETAVRAPGGAIYGTSSNGARAAFMRAKNRSPIKGLYLVGGSAHPGGGLPLVGISGDLVTEAIGYEKNARH
jgi:hypothetical protein